MEISLEPDRRIPGYEPKEVTNLLGRLFKLAVKDK
jgi:hypothetical protein